MQLSDRIRNSETHQFRTVFFNRLNDYSTLFGGQAMQWMDEVAYITATRFTRQKVVTVSVNDIHFKKAITQGSLVEIIGKVRSVGNVKLEIAVEIFVESTCCDLREKAVEALFTFSAINNRNKPVCLEHRNFNNDLPVHMNS